ncbi:NADH-quinone oxidoreductase subunit B family protein [Paraburkholderia sp. B3]|uniref:NADH-quinone oxidoreductase subunit B family protein n=1 Tax=Paraburkholderia sp. B3 TaxID=3134791 RepID=UPI003981ECD8
MTWQLLKRIAGTRAPAELIPPGGDDWRTESQRLHQQILDVLGRALCIRQIDAGSCNGCELEIHALNNPYYNIEGLGIRFVASPRHADMLLVTGPLVVNMREAVRLAYEATPEPKLVVAAGECACTGGIFKDSYAVCGPLSELLPVDVHIPGCPPPPVDLLRGILAALRSRRDDPVSPD